jgi:hypothetical protein
MPGCGPGLWAGVSKGHPGSERHSFRTERPYRTMQRMGGAIGIKCPAAGELTVDGLGDLSSCLVLNGPRCADDVTVADVVQSCGQSDGLIRQGDATGGCLACAQECEVAIALSVAEVGDREHLVIHPDSALRRVGEILVAVAAEVNPSMVRKLGANVVPAGRRSFKDSEVIGKQVCQHTLLVPDVW